MIVLGINSAFGRASLALAYASASEARLLGEIFLNNKENPKLENLPKDIKKFLSFFNLKPKEIDVISIITGPGSYSGLRMGLVIAKTMAQTLNQKIIAIDSFENIAWQLRHLKGLLIVILKATQKFYNLAVFALKQKSFERLTKDIILEEEKIIKFLSKINGHFFLAGNFQEIYAKIKKMNQKSLAITFEFPEVNLYSASSVALLGLEKAQKNEFFPEILSLSPYYLHQVKITFKNFKYNFEP